ncbi:MAG: BON domain-containing protein [Planctomycetia bacterium]
MLTSIRSVPRLLAFAAPLFLTATALADDLASRVTARIQEAAELRAASIEIRTLGPTVWLIGTVNDESQQRSARLLAESTPGVKRVVDQIVVAGSQASQPTVAAQKTSSTDIAAQVAAALRESGKMAGYRVSVKAKDGTVWLSGTVASPEQLQAAMSLAETTPGVERVVNGLAVSGPANEAPEAAKPGMLSIPESLLAAIGMAKADSGVERAVATNAAGGVVQASAEEDPVNPVGSIQLVQAQAPMARASYPMPTSRGGPAGRPNAPLPQSRMAARPMAPKAAYAGQPSRNAIRTAAYGESMSLPGPDGHQDFGPIDGQMVPGSMRVSEGGMAGGAGMGRPMPMGATGVGMPPVPVRGGGPNMPNYAWPSYAANPNYAAVQYPTQYSPTAWPYIGPFYPYPQVPLGWRRVSLEWDDGWWFLDFDERHIHNHHR